MAVTVYKRNIASAAIIEIKAFTDSITFAGAVMYMALLVASNKEAIRNIIHFYSAHTDNKFSLKRTA